MDATGRVTRIKASGPPSPCLCGRTFTTRSGKANHARHCPDVWARNAVQLAQFNAINERALARLAAQRARTDP